MGRVEYKVKKLFEVRAYKFKELCAIYKVHPMTMRKWFEKIEVRFSPRESFYKIPQMEVIAEKIGLPYMIYDIDDEPGKETEERKELLHPFQMRPYKFKELATLYRVDPKTLRKWIAPFKEEVGEIKGDYYWIPQIEAIIKNIGLPYFIHECTDDKKAA